MSNPEPPYPVAAQEVVVTAAASVDVAPPVAAEEVGGGDPYPSPGAVIVLPDSVTV